MITYLHNSLKEEFDSWNVENLVQAIDNQLNVEGTSDLLEMKNEIDKQLTYDIQKTIIRYVYVILDTSSSMKLKDIKPTRLACTIEFIKVINPNKLINNK